MCLILFNKLQVSCLFKFCNSSRKQKLGKIFLILIFFSLEKISCIIVQGGFSNGYFCDTIDFITGGPGIKKLPSLPYGIHGSSMVQHNGTILFCGGSTTLPGRVGWIYKLNKLLGLVSHFVYKSPISNSLEIKYFQLETIKAYVNCWCTSHTIQFLIPF